MLIFTTTAIACCQCQPVNGKGDESIIVCVSKSCVPAAAAAMYIWVIFSRFLGGCLGFKGKCCLSLQG